MKPGEVRGNADSAMPVVIVGAGVIGCTAAWALTKAGRRVLLIDRDEPATAGASFGNVGHIATEQLAPLPSPGLLFNFWRQLVAFGGPLDLPARRLIPLAPWIRRFALAAFEQRENTQHLAPMVRCSAEKLQSALGEVGAADLLRRRGHFAVWLGPRAAENAAAERERAASLDINTSSAPQELLRCIAAQAQTASRTVATPAGVWFPDSAHVSDPRLVAQAFATASLASGASFRKANVKSLQPTENGIDVITDTGTLPVRTVLVCAGAWSAPLLAPFGIRAPLEAERGYHVEMFGQSPLTDAPILYAEQSIVVTPMQSRLRASSYLEFAGLTAPPDARKPARLRERLRLLGYRCEPEGPSWMGPRPTLPDYLPGIGKARGRHDLYYAIGHQHLGLTLAAGTAELVADLVTGRPPRMNIAPFDLARFGSPPPRS